MSDRVSNRRDPSRLPEADVEAALARIAQRDRDVREEARHVYETLTWGEGPAQLRQAGVQDSNLEPWFPLPVRTGRGLGVQRRPGALGVLGMLEEPGERPW